MRYRLDDRKCRPGGQDSDEVLKEILDKKEPRGAPAESRAALSFLSRARTRHSNSTIKPFPASPGVGRRRATPGDAEMLILFCHESVSPSRHPQRLASRRANPGTPRRLTLVLIFGIPGRNLASLVLKELELLRWSTRLALTLPRGVRRERASDERPEAERDSAETGGPLPETTQDLFNHIVLRWRRLRREQASDEGREHLEFRAAAGTPFRIVLPDFRDEPRPVAFSHLDELALLIHVVHRDDIRCGALGVVFIDFRNPAKPSPECYCLIVVDSAP